MNFGLSKCCCEPPCTLQIIVYFRKCGDAVSGSATVTGPGGYNVTQTGTGYTIFNPTVLGSYNVCITVAGYTDCSQNVVLDAHNCFGGASICFPDPGLTRSAGDSQFTCQGYLNVGCASGTTYTRPTFTVQAVVDGVVKETVTSDSHGKYVLCFPFTPTFISGSYPLCSNVIEVKVTGTGRFGNAILTVPVSRVSPCASFGSISTSVWRSTEGDICIPAAAAYQYNNCATTDGTLPCVEPVASVIHMSVTLVTGTVTLTANNAGTCSPGFWLGSGTFNYPGCNDYFGHVLCPAESIPFTVSYSGCTIAFNFPSHSISYTVAHDGYLAYCICPGTVVPVGTQDLDNGPKEGDGDIVPFTGPGFAPFSCTVTCPPGFAANFNVNGLPWSSGCCPGSPGSGTLSE